MNEPEKSLTVNDSAKLANNAVEIIKSKLNYTCEMMNQLKESGDIDGAWFLMGMAISFQDSLEALGEEDVFPGCDPISMILGMDKEEKVIHLHHLSIAWNYPDFIDYIPDNLHHEYYSYLKGLINK